LQEIHEIFPNYAEADFDELLQNDTLEQVIKIDKVKKSKHLHDMMDYKFIRWSFIALIAGNSGSGRDYLEIFKNVAYRKFHIKHAFSSIQYWPSKIARLMSGNASHIDWIISKTFKTPVLAREFGTIAGKCQEKSLSLFNTSR
jgi:hypothetical protein